MTLDDLRPADAFDHVFSGAEAVVTDSAGAVHGGLARWLATPDAADRHLFLDRCRGATIDIGCGPGRLAIDLAGRRVPTLGIDVSPAAVRLAQDGGATALTRDVFGDVPAEGRWDHALLADGNIGIGGDPVRLLARVSRIVRAGGTVIAEVGPAGTGLVRHPLRLQVAGLESIVIEWASVGLDAIDEVAHRAGLLVDAVLQHGRRQAVVLSPARGR